MSAHPRTKTQRHGDTRTYADTHTHPRPRKCKRLPGTFSEHIRTSGPAHTRSPTHCHLTSHEHRKRRLNCNCWTFQDPLAVRNSAAPANKETLLAMATPCQLTAPAPLSLAGRTKHAHDPDSGPLLGERTHDHKSADPEKQGAGRALCSMRAETARRQRLPPHTRTTTAQHVQTHPHHVTTEPLALQFPEF